MTYINPTVIIYEDCFKERIEKAITKTSPTNLKYFLSSNLSIDQSVEKVLFKPVSDVENYSAPDLGDPKEVVLTMPMTSGSTGKQKSMKISHAFYLLGMTNWFEQYEGTRYYIGSLFGWMSQIAAVVFPVLLDQLRIYSDNDPTPEYMAQVVYDTKATHFFSASFAVPDLIDYCVANDKVHYLGSLRKLMTGGAPIPETLYNDIESLLPECQFICGYGMTEMNGPISTDELLKEHNDGMLLQDGLQLKCVDENHKTVGRNVNGKICVKPFGYDIKFLMYHNLDEVNQENFIDGWISTGDYGRMNDKDLLQVYGRYKDLIFCDGEVVSFHYFLFIVKYIFILLYSKM